jgi:hypothetical protein
MVSKTTTTPAPDPAIRLELAQEALEQYRQWDQGEIAHSMWPVVLGAAVSSLELVLKLVDGAQ